MLKADSDPLSAKRLSADRLELLGHLLEVEGIETKRDKGRASTRSVRQLSFAQERMWFFEQLVKGTPTYHLAEVLQINGPLDTASLQLSIDEIVRRHESLRMTFDTVDGTPIQVVIPRVKVALHLTDLREYPEREGKAHIARLANDNFRTSFDLSKAPLLRTVLIRTGECEHILVIIMHHIISDGWSIEVFTRELTELYDAFSRGRESPLPALPTQYSDYALMEREAFEKGELRDELEYWKRGLSGVLPVLDLPTDQPRPSTQSFNGAYSFFSLSPSLSRALVSMDLQEGVTLFMALLTAYASVLGRWSGQGDVIIGTALANRSRPELQGLIGLFVNTLPLRLDLRGNPSYKELLRRAKKVVLDAFDHQNVPFEKIVESVQPKRDPSRPVLYQTGFAIQNTLAQSAQQGAIEITRANLDLNLSVARLDLTLFTWEEGGELKGALEYNTDLFASATIEAAIEYFRLVIADMVADPDHRVLSLPSELEKLRQDSAGSPGSVDEEKRDVSDDSFLELSNMAENQLLFWSSKKLQPDVQLYYERVIGVFEIHGATSPVLFQNAFESVVRNSDALRSVIVEIDGIPRRRVLETMPMMLEYLDLSTTPSPTETLKSLLKDRSHTPLPLENKLFQSFLAKLSADRFVWYMDVHHMIVDLWSLSLVARFVSDYYRLALDGRLDQALPLAHYEEFTRYQREYRKTEAYRSSEAYWNKKLAEPLTLSRFYASDSTSHTTRIERVSIDLGLERSDVIKELTQKEALFSPAAVFAAVLFAYLHRVTGERVLRIGFPFANRPPGFQETIGVFLNACPLQIAIEERETFASLARKVRREIVHTAKHQHYPIRNPFNNRVYEAYFNYQNLSFTDFAGMPVRFDLINSGESNDSIDLQVRDFRCSGSFTVDFDFNVALFDEEQRERTANHFLRMLDALIGDSHQAIKHVRFISDREKERLHGFNQTAAPYQRGVCLHRVIEACVDQAPAAIALVYEESQLSYEGLNRRANRVAHFLNGISRKRSPLVGVLAERSVEMIVGILGILKAGGAYVPLDPSHPDDRLKFMIEDTGIDALLTQDRLAGRLTIYQGKVLRLDTEWEAMSGCSEGDPAVQSDEEDLAYVMYTSGSTGRPKGVMITHRAICNRLFWMQKAYGLSVSDRVLQKTPFTFDVSVWEFFWPLFTGAGLVVARPGGHQEPRYLIDSVVKHGITTIHFVPSMLQAFLECTGLEACKTLKLVICSGEVLPVGLKQRFYQRLDAQLENLYGPTEAAVDVTSYACSRHAALNLIPIGRPIDNVRINLLDADLNPVPPGIAGELYIGGIALARAYLGRPDLTSERFIPDPLATHSGARLYKTGDVGRYLAEGDIQFLGRIDHQVKIRGFRVELGEIEAVLAQNKSVQECAVTVAENGPGDTRLLCYVVAVPGARLEPAYLRNYVKDRLPEYMIPSPFILLDRLPLTPSGKIDRKALPAPDQANAVFGQEFVAPRTEMEQLVAEAWKRVLRIKDLSVTHDFFALGGHSLLAIQVLSRLHQSLPIELPLLALFQAPTVAGLAEKIEQLLNEQDEEELKAMEELLSEFE